MRNIILLFLFLHWHTGNLLSQGSIDYNSNSDAPKISAGFERNTGHTGNQPAISYSLGGHLFAGDYPINNPVNTGDTGTVFLYQLTNNSLIPIDTTQFSNLGYFVFLNVLEGEYILKASLTENSENFKNYFPSYYKSSLRWNSSYSVKLTDSSIFEANIRLLPTFNPLSGPASIKGYVVQSSDEDGFHKLIHTEVLLLNDKLEPLTFCFSDHTGGFSFPNLPYGTYNVSVESTGRFSALHKIILDQDHPDFDNLQLEVFGHYPANVEELDYPSGTFVSTVFPNPAEEYIRLVINQTEPGNLNLAIFSLTGKKVISRDLQITGIRSFEFPVGSLAKGTYVLILRDSHGKWMKVQKFVKL